MIGATIRQYRIIGEIKPGKGGMGDLYLAEHVSLPKRFAIKCLKPALTQDPQFHKRFYQEAKEQALLDHANIVQAIDFFKEDEQYFFVMEFVEGEDLDSLIKRKASLAEKEALDLFKGILRGLQFAHRKGVIHRDIKPSNVLIDEHGRPRITDFGIAILAGSERLTATGTTIGTPWYMSPEQIRRPKDVDGRSDIYAAGILLYEMLTGDVPYDGETDFSIKEQQVNSPIPDPRNKNPAISNGLAEIIKTAMAKSPTRRFADCSEFLKAIAAYEKQRDGVPQRRRGLWVAVLVGLVMVTAAVVRHFSGDVGDGNGEALKKSAFLLIRDASERAAMICREFKEIELRKKNMAIAEDRGRTGLADVYAKDIDERETAVKRWNKEYDSSIAQLAAIPRQVVDDQLERYEASLVEENSIAKIAYLRFVQDHFRQFDGGVRSGVSITPQRCVSTN